ncbi:MAG TPA: NUDIX domain-containing protein [Thermomicrobiales bacterium]|nr:NUDIX domain-containing protein [Thermomicrobiales bacterium]
MLDMPSPNPNQPVIFVIVNVEVAIVRDGRYLVTERGSGESYGAGWLGFPGGKLEWGERDQDAIEATARREAEEETGVILGPEIAYVESHTFGTDAPCLDIVMLGRPAAHSPEAIIRDPEEVAALAWMTLAEIAADPRTQPWTLASLDRAEAVREQLGW